MGSTYGQYSKSRCQCTYVYVCNVFNFNYNVHGGTVHTKIVIIYPRVVLDMESQKYNYLAILSV